MVIDYYFSVLSDWAYFGGERLECLARRYGVPINHMPVRLARIYERTGGIVLQKRSKQRQDYRIVELRRWGQYLGIPIKEFPAYYPTDDVLASCVIIAARKAGLDTGLLANRILRAIWAEDRDISDPATLADIASGLGFDGQRLVDSAGASTMVDELDRYTREAEERGVFGSPFYVVGDDVYWGQDRLEFLEDALVRMTGSARRRPLIAKVQGG